MLSKLLREEFGKAGLTGFLFRKRELGAEFDQNVVVQNGDLYNK